MTEALAHLPLAQPLLLVVLVFGGLGLRRWGKGGMAVAGTVMIWLALALAAAWLAWSVTQMLQLIRT